MSDIPDQAEPGRDPFDSEVLYGAPAPEQEEDPNENIPDEIAALFDEHGLDAKWYRCDLKKYHSAEGSGAFVAMYDKSYPTIEDVGLNFGPGKYLFTFFWRKKIDGKNKMQTRKFYFDISEEFRDRYEDYQFEKQRKRRKERKRKLAMDRETRRMYDDEDDTPASSQSPAKDPMQIAQEYIEQHMRTNQMLFGNSGSQRSPAFEWEKLVPLGMAVLTFLSNRSDSERSRQDQFMTMMLKMSQDSTSNLLDVVRRSNNPTGLEMMKDMKDMIMAGVDIKSALNPEKESVLDRVMGVIEGALPVMAQMMSQPRAQSKQSIPYQMAQSYVQTDKDFQQVLSDPEMREAAIQRMDREFGWEQANYILDVAGIRRSTPNNDPSQRYPEGDERNTVPEADAEVVEPTPEPEPDATSEAEQAAEG